jgi:ABC-2 type transport system permease protein
MKQELRAFLGGMNAELNRLRRSRLLIALVLVQAVTFLFLVTLFGMTGAFAPTALVNNDNGPLAQVFITNLENDHHSFALISMNNETVARELVARGDLVAMIVIPQGFSEGISEGRTVPVTVFIDNINSDLTADIQRAMPSAILSFSEELKFEGANVSVVETDSYTHDTSFINYMIASALVLDAFIISSTLSALSIAEEFQSKTARLLAISPVHPLIPMIGRVVATAMVSAGALAITAAVALAGYGISPANPLEIVLTLLFCIAIFSCIGAALGAVVKKTLPVTLIILGIALPLFLFSGSYEPERFDGNLIWGAAHFSPEYYAVGLMEHAVFDLKVTPEPLSVLALALLGWGIGALVLAWFYSRKGLS